jgi:hypothetical protein
MSQESLLVKAFRTELQILGRDFVCPTALPATAATVSFIGVFQGQSVLWQMTLATLAHWQITGSKAHLNAESEMFNQPFIEIDEGNEGVFPIRVGLNLDLIDEPVIKKTIIMVRNYKRLALGRSGFGSAPT